MKERYIKNAVEEIVKKFDISYSVMRTLQKTDEKYENAINTISNFISYNLELIKEDDIFLSDAIQHSFMYIIGICMPFNTAEDMAKDMMELIMTKGELQ